jgi:outer membrane biosynthesis protein TonB
MEEFIQIIIFVGAMVIAVIGQNTKSKKKPMDASPQEVLEDMFPEIELQEDEAMTAPTPAPAPVRKKPRKKTTPNVMKTPVEPPKESSKKEQKISLNSREKARQAFIYSEIFNRKY